MGKEDEYIAKKIGNDDTIVYYEKLCKITSQKEIDDFTKICKKAQNVEKI